MATEYKLVLTFQDTDGKNFIISYNHFDGENATDAQVKTFVNALIANGSFLQRVPATCISAKKVMINSTDFDLS